MRNLLEFYADDSINCADSEKAMNRMHAECEREGGVCNLAMLLDNKDAFLEIYSFRCKIYLLFLLTIDHTAMQSCSHALTRLTSLSSFQSSHAQQISEIHSKLW